MRLPIVLALAASAAFASSTSAALLSFFGRSPVLPAAEISAFDPITDRLLTVGPGGVEILNFANPAAPTPVAALNFSSPTPGLIYSPNSVAVRNGVAAVAVEVSDTSTGTGVRAAKRPGFVRFFDVATGTQIGSDVTVGAQPDMITFTPDGTRLLTANEGESNGYYTTTSTASNLTINPNLVDPEGSVSIIDVSSGVANATVQTATFTSFNSQINTLRASGVRIFGPNATVAQDLEPEYITVKGDKAYVTLQDNNALAVIDIPTATVTNIKSFGLKDHSLAGNRLDPSDQDSQRALRNAPIFGMYQPDAIDSFVVAGQTFLITANEGDSRADFFPNNVEEIRLGNAGYVLDPTVFPNAAALKANSNLGRLNVSRATGNLDGDNDFDQIHAYGTRSFSIWNAAGDLVWDSGEILESIALAQDNARFNASHDASASPDSRSDDKGPEPEAVTIGEVNGRIMAFIANERLGGVMTFDVTNPAAPSFVQYINTWPVDRGPEGLIFIPAVDSPNGYPLLVVSNEISNTVSVFIIPEPTALSLLAPAALLLSRRKR